MGDPVKVTFHARSKPRIFPYHYGEELGRAVYRRVPALEDHDAMSVHSVGWIWGNAETTKRGLVFSGRLQWSLGASEEIIEAFLESVDNDPELIDGLLLEGGKRRYPSPSGRYVSESPILIRREGDHLPFRDPEADDRLTYSARSKLEAIGIPKELADQVSARFVPDDSARTKVATICGNQFRGNQCPVQIDAPHAGLEEALMTTGLGALTGMGLGAIAPATQPEE